MQSVVVKGSVAYFNTGSGKNFVMPKDGFIHSNVMHCGRRTIGTGGSYVPSPLDFEKGDYAGFRAQSQSRMNWSNRYNKQLEMVCPTELLSKEFDEAMAWDDKQN